MKHKLQPPAALGEDSIALQAWQQLARLGVIQDPAAQHTRLVLYSASASDLIGCLARADETPPIYKIGGQVYLDPWVMATARALLEVIDHAAALGIHEAPDPPAGKPPRARRKGG